MQKSRLMWLSGIGALTLLACSTSAPNPKANPDPSASATSGQILNATLNTPSGASPAFEGQYRIFVPTTTAPLRGVIVRQHGCGANGITLAQDLHWQAFAMKWNMAVLGTYYPTDCDNWAYPERGSLEMMKKALTDFGTQSKHPELATVPWALWGHSGGAYWTYFMTQQVPERIIANVSRTGVGGSLPAAARAIPQLLAIGEGENGHSEFGPYYSGTINIFNNERGKGALMALSIDPQATHDLRWGRLISMAFFDAVFAQRLPAQYDQPLNALDTSKAWLGNNSTRSIAAASAYSGDTLKASWFPDQSFAERWKTFEADATIDDTTPPPAPTLSVTRTGSTAKLTWSGGIDVETGIRAFKIYRNDELIEELGFEFGPFQGPGFGDDPQPAEPNMSFEDPSSPQNAQYQISAVNNKGIESAKSQP
jgi:hypothetical protein